MNTYILVDPNDDTGNDDGIIDKLEMTEEEARKRNDRYRACAIDRRWIIHGSIRKHFVSFQNFLESVVVYRPPFDRSYGFEDCFDLENIECFYVYRDGTHIAKRKPSFDKLFCLPFDSYEYNSDSLEALQPVLYNVWANLSAGKEFFSDDVNNIKKMQEIIETQQQLLKSQIHQLENKIWEI